MIDFAAADGVLAMTCARDGRIPYLGFCLTPAHKSMLRTKLIQDAMRDSCTEKDSRYDAQLAKLMAPEAAAPNEEARKKEAEAKNNNDEEPDDGAAGQGRVRREPAGQ